MAHGYTYHCEGCGFEWEQTELKVDVGPSVPGARTRFRCPACQFELNIISEIDGVAWASWKQANSDMIAGSHAISQVAAQIDRILDGKQFSAKAIELDGAVCHFCHTKMKPVSEAGHSVQCRRCHSIDITVIGEFAESVSYIDPNDARRWWKFTR